VYDVIAEPPSLTGAVKLTVALELPGLAVPIVGAPGPVEGVMAFEADEALPVPLALIAWTEKVYVVPLLRPATLIGLPVPLAVDPPGLAVTVYPVIAEPPLLSGAVKYTVALALAEMVLPTVGAPGTVVETTMAVDAETFFDPLIWPVLKIERASSRTSPR